jgi:hypothetical protein
MFWRNAGVNLRARRRPAVDAPTDSANSRRCAIQDFGVSIASWPAGMPQLGVRANLVGNGSFDVA